MRFHHISTDEVFGTLGPVGLHRGPPYAPKVRTPHQRQHPITSSGPGQRRMASVVLTNSTNNYGPYQFPEKLIPVVITRALVG